VLPLVCAKITERAGLSSPRMISYHFDSKDDLIHEILVHVFTAGAEFINERVEAEGTPVGKLRAYVEVNLQFLRAHPQDIAALTEIGPHLRDVAGQRSTSIGAQEVSVQGLEKLLADGHVSGEFRDFDVRSMAVLIRGAISPVLPG
jgi:AcrR family transcriptional regulator